VDFAERSGIIRNMLEHMIGNQQIKRVIRKRHGQHVDLANFVVRRIQIATYIRFRRKGAEYSRQSFFGREMEDIKTRQSPEQSRRLEVQQQMAFAVVRPAAGAFEMIHVTANDLERIHQPRHATGTSAIRHELPYAMIADGTVTGAEWHPSGHRVSRQLD